MELQNLLNNDDRLKNVEYESIPVDTFATFTEHHLHRIGVPIKPEFRFRLMATERDEAPYNWDKAHDNKSHVFTGNYGQKVPSIIKEQNNIIINTKFD